MTAVRARRRDRRVYLASHPFIFGLLVSTRARPVTRLGRTVLVQSPDAYVEALTRLPLDRAAARTTGGLAREFVSDGVLFDQDGVVVDSEGAWDGARRAIVAENGGRWKPDATRTMMGMSAPEWSRYPASTPACQKARTRS